MLAVYAKLIRLDRNGLAITARVADFAYTYLKVAPVVSFQTILPQVNCVHQLHLGAAHVKSRGFLCIFGTRMQAQGHLQTLQLDAGLA